jgi:hypothetical protein
MRSRQLRSSVRAEGRLWAKQEAARRRRRAAAGQGSRPPSSHARPERRDRPPLAPFAQVRAQVLVLGCVSTRTLERTRKVLQLGASHSWLRLPGRVVRARASLPHSKGRPRCPGARPREARAAARRGVWRPRPRSLAARKPAGLASSLARRRTPPPRRATSRARPGPASGATGGAEEPLEPWPSPAREERRAASRRRGAGASLARAAAGGEVSNEQTGRTPLRPERGVAGGAPPERGPEAAA